MNLRQLKFISEVARRGLSISAAAEALYTSQPGVSKQIRQLEDELGVEIFERRGKQLSRVTDAGHAILRYAGRALVEVESLKEAAREFREPSKGSLSIATTHTQARYRLPSVIEAFRERFPEVALHIHQGTPEQIASMVRNGTVDFAIATEAPEHFDELVMMPCYRWRRAVFTPKGHPLLDDLPLSLAKLAGWPLVTYVFGFTGRSEMDKAFRKAQLEPNVSFTATDADVLKTYVRMGLGVGVIAAMAYDPQIDTDLVLTDASDLFPADTTSIGFRRGIFLRGYMYAFIEGFAPHLTRDMVDTAVSAGTPSALRGLFVDVSLPEF